MGAWVKLFKVGVRAVVINNVCIKPHLHRPRHPRRLRHIQALRACAHPLLRLADILSGVALSLRLLHDGLAHALDRPRLALDLQGTALVPFVSLARTDAQTPGQRDVGLRRDCRVGAADFGGKDLAAFD